MENKFNYTKRVLFFGMPDMGTICLARLVREGVNIVGAVAPPKNDLTYPAFCNIANYFKLNLITYDNSLKDADFLQKIKDLKPDVAIVCSYSKLFPKELLDIIPNRFVNVHPSLLPQYRGPNAYSHAIKDGVEKTGITLHIMDEHFDTGDMIVAREIPIDSDETMGTLFNKLNFSAGELLVQFMQRFEKMKELKGKKQPAGDYKYAHEITDNVIDWSQDGKSVERFVRALNPFISAVTFFRKMAIKVYKVRLLDKQIKAPPGTVLNVEKGLFVNTANGIIEIKVCQVGSFFLSDGRDFIRVFKIKKGEKFTNG